VFVAYKELWNETGYLRPFTLGPVVPTVHANIGGAF
jgi:hypothetical protein